MLSNLFLLPYLWYYHRFQLLDALQNHKCITLFMAPCVVGAYMIVLYVFQMRDVNIGLVVALRELSVIFGAAMGKFARACAPVELCCVMSVNTAIRNSR
jgi:hypothetical protein